MSAKIIQGEDRNLTVQLKDGDGTNLDLTSYVGIAPANIEACFISTGVAISVDFQGGDISVNGSNDCGSITIALTAANTLLLSPDAKDFEIDLTDAAGKKRIVQLTGVLDIKEQIC